MIDKLIHNCYCEPMTTPESVRALCSTLKNAGHQAFVVGGAVRDTLLGREVHDWDVATSARPEAVLKLFPHTVATGLKHGTVTVVCEDMSVEVTTFRGDGDYSDGRHPDSVKFVETIEEDLSRRDFCINAMALDPLTDEVVDPFGGKTDLLARMVRAVGDPSQRFNEDGLRPLRAIRFAATLGFDIHIETFNAINPALPVFRNVSWERRRDELLKILASDKPAPAIVMMDACGLLAEVLPELVACKGQRQNRFHTEDVFVHSILTLVGMTQRDPLLRLTALLHDIGKPSTAAPTSPGEFSFLEHEVIGAGMVAEVCRRLKLSNEERERVVHLVHHHCRLISPSLTGPGRRRFIKAVGKENLDAMFALNWADSMSDCPDSIRADREVDFLVVTEAIREESKKEPPVSTRQLAISGEDVMAALGVGPGKPVGDALRSLMELVLDDPSKNTREALLAELERMKA